MGPKVMHTFGTTQRLMLTALPQRLLTDTGIVFEIRDEEATADIAAGAMVNLIVYWKLMRVSLCKPSTTSENFQCWSRDCAVFMRSLQRYKASRQSRRKLANPPRKHATPPRAIAVRFSPVP